MRLAPAPLALVLVFVFADGLVTAAEAASPPGDPTGLDAASTVLSRYPAGRVPVEPLATDWFASRLIRT